MLKEAVITKTFGILLRYNFKTKNDSVNGARKFGEEMRLYLYLVAYR